MLRDTFGTFAEKLPHFNGGLCHRECDSEVVGQEDPLVVSELAKIREGDHFNEFESCEEVVRVLGDLVVDVYAHELLAEGLHEEGEYHGPNINEELVEGDLREPQDQNA